MQNSLIESACDFAAQGIPVFPLRPNSKLPYPGSAGFKDATTDLEVVKAWWTARPDSNIGLATGVYMDVLDLDGVDGAEGFEQWCEEHGGSDTFPLGPTVLTPSGGQHVWVNPTSAGNRAGMIPKVDWRGIGGYVLAPPSIVNGKPYRWLDAGEPMHNCPVQLRALVLPSREERPAANVLSIRERLERMSASPSGLGYGETALEREIDELLRARQGERNHALNKAAFALYQLVKGGELDGGRVDAALSDAAATIGLSVFETEATLKSAYAGALPRQAPVREVAPAAPFAGTANTASQGTPLVYDPELESTEDPDFVSFLAELEASFLTVEELLARPDPEALIAEHLMLDSLVLMWGPPAAKKSFTALDMALHVATGMWWHGNQVEPGEVIYFVGEGVNGLKARVRAWSAHHSISRLTSFHPVERAFSMLDHRVETRAAVEACRRRKPKLVVIDTLNRHSLGADENASKDWGLIVKAADAIRVATGACVLVIHHANAGGDRERGHTSLLGAVDTSIKVISDQGDTRTTLEWRKMKDSKAPDPMFLYTLPVEGSGSIVLADTYQGTEDTGEDIRRKVGCTLYWVSGTGATEDEIVAEVGEKGWTVKMALTRMLQDGQVEKSGHRWKLTDLRPFAPEEAAGW